MKAVVFHSSSGLSLDDQFPKPSRGPTEALVKVIRAGICNTDLEITKGYMGFEGILGHEFVGRVEEIDENERGIRIGQRVVGEINLACNSCEICSNGGIRKRNHCPKRTVLGILNKDGTFAEYLTLPVDNLFPVPDNVSDAAAAFVEPLAAAFRPMEQGLITWSEKIAVVGDGKLGLLIAEAIFSLNPGNLVIFGHHSKKMQLLPGAITKVVVEKKAPKDYEDYFDVVVEATGHPDGLMMSAELTRPLGTLVLKTTCSAGSGEFNTAPFVIKEISVIGSRCGNFESALAALAQSAIKPEKYIEQVYKSDDALEAINHAAKRGTLKIQLLFE